MTTPKEGRPRQFIGFGDMEYEIAHLHELHARAWDLVEDVPADVRGQEFAGHSVGSLFQHMIWAEARWVSLMDTQAGTKADTKADTPDFDTLEGLEQYVDQRITPRDLGDPFDGPRFDTIGQMIRHLQWHWSYHSAQIGLVRKQLGFAYKWQ